MRKHITLPAAVSFHVFAQRSYDEKYRDRENFRNFMPGYMNTLPEPTQPKEKVEVNMNLEQRVQMLEQEVQLLKAQIRAELCSTCRSSCQQ
ncbi:MAG: hypothetical protein U0703_28170 [Anaerolineae bacterium]